MAVSHGSWWPQWAGVTAAAALVASLLDAALLQRRRTYFTGGFLSVDHVTSGTQAAGFVAGSLLADAAVAAVLAAFTLWALWRLHFSHWTAMAGAFAIALAPLVIADFISYQLVSFFGDAFDATLMFGLVGRNPAELLAVSSAQVIWAGLVIVVALVVLLAIMALMRRRGGPTGSTPSPPSLFRVAMPALALLLVGVLGTTTLRSASDVLDNGLRRKPSGQMLGAIVRAVSDVDRDGFGLLGRPADPAPFDAAIRPWAVEIPGNGVDEDGVAGDLPADAAPYVETDGASPEFAHKPNVLLIVLESFRADAVGARLDGQPVTPTLDALAARGVSPAHAYSHNGFTVQSRRHLFSGSVADLRGSATLIDDFNKNGYETAYFSGQDESFGGPEGGVGFDRAAVAYDARSDKDLRYTTFTTAGSLALPSSVVVAKVAEYLGKRHDARPLFLYVNLHDTHFPYHHREIEPLLRAPVLTQFEIQPARARDVHAMYLNTAANVDRAIGQLLSSVRTAFGSEPAVVVTSDHGESLFEEGFLGHGYALNDAQTRIPLIAVNLPLAVAEPFGQADLRDALHRALGARVAPAPPVAPEKTRRIFQYLGSIHQPAQIAFTRLDRRVMFDFRSGLARIDAGESRRPERFSPLEQAEIFELIHTWERMMLAREK